MLPAPAPGPVIARGPALAQAPAPAAQQRGGGSSAVAGRRRRLLSAEAPDDAPAPGAQPEQALRGDAGMLPAGEAVAAAQRGDLQGQSEEAVMAEAEAAVLWKALEERGYRRVPGKPNLAREAGSLDYREAVRAGALADTDGDGVGDVFRGSLNRRRALREEEPERRRLLVKDRYVKEEANYGRVNYGMRIVRVERIPLVHGEYLQREA